MLNQVRVGGLEARAFDETFPRELGIPGEETIGPGGFANALRTLPVVLDSMRVLEEVAPHALVLNLTNPAGLVQYATTHYTQVRMLSLCDSPITLGDELAKLVEQPRERLTIDYLGMNHLGWAVSLRTPEGEELLGRALERVEHLKSLSVDPAYVRASRAVPSAYVRYYLHADRILAQQQGKAPRARQLLALEQDLLAEYERDEGRGAEVVTRRGALWYDAIIVPVLDALINDRGQNRVVNVRNGRLLPWLSEETVIEVPARLDREGAHALPTRGDLLAAELRLLLQAQASYEELAAPAIVEQSRELALRALVANPLVHSPEQAEQVLARIWPSGFPEGGSAL